MGHFAGGHKLRALTVSTSDHNIAVDRSATVAVSTRRRCGPRPTAVAPASSIDFTSVSVKSGIQY
ncbi:hypothetical protein CTI12_AA173660 [Artemisia annua]|uniref:Uncharacterized protein n=1 Tax=Artemisia annua TaxID=35608 RepID=A0A2U1MX07_ARTAN|nr:hypothetical protein CTI12_AA173660 [Artemisia annua]